MSWLYFLLAEGGRETHRPNPNPNPFTTCWVLCTENLCTILPLPKFNKLLQKHKCPLYVWNRSDHHSETPPAVVTDCSDSVEEYGSQTGGGAATVRQCHSCQKCNVKTEAGTSVHCKLWAREVKLSHLLKKSSESAAQSVTPIQFDSVYPEQWHHCIGYSIYHTASVQLDIRLI